MPFYLLGKRGTIESVIEPAPTPIESAADASGPKRHYYRVAIPMTEIWPDYAGSVRDGLRLEIFDAWLAGL